MSDEKQVSLTQDEVAILMKAIQNYGIAELFMHEISGTVEEFKGQAEIIFSSREKLHKIFHEFMGTSYDVCAARENSEHN